MKIAFSRTNGLLMLLCPMMATTRAQQCPPDLAPIGNAVSIPDYIAARTACTAACNNEGYCCDKGYGGCDKVPCNTGCHIAFFSDTIAACKQECSNANTNVDQDSCDYTHERHWETGLLGFNPAYEGYGTGVATCAGSEICGCPPNNWGNVGSNPGNECTIHACDKGCDLAATPALVSQFYHGQTVQFDYSLGLDETTLLDALDQLTLHSQGNIVLSGAQIDSFATDVDTNKALLETSLATMEAALDLVDEYETNQGPLFRNSATSGGFARTSSTDGKQLERAMLVT